MKRKVGIVGYGKLGQFLAHHILQDPTCSENLELCFVWNRNPEKILEDPLISANLVLHNLDEFATRKADLIVEVAHPIISKSHGSKFLECADYMVGSPTAFADPSVEEAVLAVANGPSKYGMYVPSGALWGAQDIFKMAQRGSLKGLKICMKKHPSSIKGEGEVGQALKELIESGEKGEKEIYKGSVRGICPLAPNNVNTMACAALAGHNLGFDKVEARLVADLSLEAHVIDIEVIGPGPDSAPFSVSTRRFNPAVPGAVTGNATYASFLSSMLASSGRGSGVHFV